MERKKIAHSVDKDRLFTNISRSQDRLRQVYTTVLGSTRTSNAKLYMKSPLDGKVEIKPHGKQVKYNAEIMSKSIKLIF